MEIEKKKTQTHKNLKKKQQLKYTRKDEGSNGVPVCTKLVRDAIAWGI